MGETDLSSSMDSEPGEEKKEDRKPTYDGYAESPIVSGDVKITLDKDGIILDTLFDRSVIHYADIYSFTFQNYTFHVSTALGNITFSRMGNSCEWLYRELLETYNKKVLQAFLVEGSAEFETNAQCALTENGSVYETSGKVQIFKDCLCIMPPNTSGRRFPFVFMNGMKKDGYSLTLTMRSGESCTFSKLGYDLDSLEKKISDNIRALREKEVEFIKKLDGSLGMTEISRAVKLLPEGIAAPFEKLSESLPSLASAILNKINDSTMKESYSLLKKVCDIKNLCIGVKSVSAPKEISLSANPPDALQGLAASAVSAHERPTDETSKSQPDELEEVKTKWILWVAVPSIDHNTVVVEFAFPDEDAATFIFNIEGKWEQFIDVLNRSMEAINLQREVLSLSDEELKKEKHADYRMLVVRTPVVHTLRKQFAGRVIHRTSESWLNGISAYVNKASKVPVKLDGCKAAFCTSCGAKLVAGIKFCRQCGEKL